MEVESRFSCLWPLHVCRACEEESIFRVGSAVNHQKRSISWEATCERMLALLFWPRSCGELVLWQAAADSCLRMAPFWLERIKRRTSYRPLQCLQFQQGNSSYGHICTGTTSSAACFQSYEVNYPTLYRRGTLISKELRIQWEYRFRPTRHRKYSRNIQRKFRGYVQMTSMAYN